MAEDYHLSGVEPAYGREMAYEPQAAGGVHLTARLYALPDLQLPAGAAHLDVVFRIPEGYPQQQQHGTSVTVSLAPGSPALPEGVTFDFPWMRRRENVAYPLSVWFFTVRDAFKGATADLSATPVLLRRTFPYPLRRCPSASSQGITASGSGGRGVWLTSSAGRTRGKRPYMEDVDFAHPLNVSSYHKSMLLVGVCDGHGGAECAQFLSDELPAKVSQLLKQQAQRTFSCADALFQAFRAIDKEYLGSTSNNAGSTACVLLWDGGPGNETLHVANTGDTRAVLCRSGRAVDVTLDRKASDPEEVARIARAGGFVSAGRVLGSLAVSRAIGDCDIKLGRGRFSVKNGDGSRSPGPQGVLLADPEVTSFRPLRPPGLGGGEVDEFLIIATDGLWDVLSSQQAVDALLRRMAQSSTAASLQHATDSELQRLADWLAGEAVQLGSQDNVTVRIVVFHGEAWPVPEGGEPMLPAATGGGAATSAAAAAGAAATTAGSVFKAPLQRDGAKLVPAALSSAAAAAMLIPPRSLSPSPGAAPTRQDAPPLQQRASSSVSASAFGGQGGLPPRASSASSFGSTGSADGADPYANRVIGTVGSSRFGRSDSNSSMSSGGSAGGTRPSGGGSATNLAGRTSSSSSAAATGTATAAAGKEEDLLAFLLDDSNF